MILNPTWLYKDMNLEYEFRNVICIPLRMTVSSNLSQIPLYHSPALYTPPPPTPPSNFFVALTFCLEAVQG